MVYVNTEEETPSDMNVIGSFNFAATSLVSGFFFFRNFLYLK